MSEILITEDDRNADWLIALQHQSKDQDGIPADAFLLGTPRPVEAKEAKPIAAILRRRPA